MFEFGKKVSVLVLLISFIAQGAFGSTEPRGMDVLAYCNKRYSAQLTLEMKAQVNSEGKWSCQELVQSGTGFSYRKPIELDLRDVCCDQYGTDLVQQLEEGNPYSWVCVAPRDLRAQAPSFGCRMRKMRYNCLREFDGITNDKAVVVSGYQYSTLYFRRPYEDERAVYQSNLLSDGINMINGPAMAQVQSLKDGLRFLSRVNGPTSIGFAFALQTAEDTVRQILVNQFVSEIKNHIEKFNLNAEQKIIVTQCAIESIIDYPENKSFNPLYQTKSWIQITPGEILESGYGNCINYAVLENVTLGRLGFSPQLTIGKITKTKSGYSAGHGFNTVMLPVMNKEGVKEIKKVILDPNLGISDAILAE